MFVAFCVSHKAKLHFKMQKNSTLLHVIILDISNTCDYFSHGASNQIEKNFSGGNTHQSEQLLYRKPGLQSTFLVKNTDCLSIS